MRTIPQVREKLTEVAEALNEAGMRNASRTIKQLVRNMYRRPSVRKAATESVKFTPAVAARIRLFARRNPLASYLTMAKRFYVSTGRISEALAGKRAA